MGFLDESGLGRLWGKITNKLDLKANATDIPVVDQDFSAVSDNAISNKAVTEAFASIGGTQPAKYVITWSRQIGAIIITDSITGAEQRLVLDGVMIDDGA